MLVTLILFILFFYPILKAFVCIAVYELEKYQKPAVSEKKEVPMVYPAPSRNMIRRRQSVKEIIEAHREELTDSFSFPIDDTSDDEEFIENLMEALMVYGYTYVWFDKENKCVKAHEGGKRNGKKTV